MLNNRKRNIFILGSMAVAIIFLVINAYFFKGWISATLWGFGFTIAYVLYALITKDALLGRFLFFGMCAGWIELLPDHWLVAGTKTLIYPPDEPIIDSSPMYMPFSWLVVFIQIGYIGFLLTHKIGLFKASVIVTVLGALIIPVYEHLAIQAGWWSYQNTPTIFNVPYYVIVAEGLLMTTIPFFYKKCEKTKLIAIPLLGFIQGMIMWLTCIIAFALVGK
ncbi:MAG: hypothetical protein WKF97_13430 [Chitinophagaceae bacterium]